MTQHLSPLPEPGDRVRIIGVMPNDPAPLPVGTEGRVNEVHPEVGQIWMEWDNGSRLILLTSDPYTIIRHAGPHPIEDEIRRRLGESDG